jgi:preprotein translocase SecE subunit
MKKWLKETTQFLREVWIEVRFKNGRVTWPTYENVKISTKVVIVSSIGVGLFIGILDAALGQILTSIIKSAGIG